MAAREKKPAARKPRTPRPSRPPKVRVIKVLVQPVLVVDHGTSLEELPPEVHEISAKDWPTYSSERFPRELANFERELAKREAEDG